VEGIVIDTNVFVAAGFNSKSAAARVFEGVREGRFRLIWNELTRRETEIIVRRIPRLDWASVADLFQPEAEFAGPVDLEAFTAISDPSDRKFAALSAAVNVPLITNDVVEHLLADPTRGKPPGVKELIPLLKYGAFFKDRSFAEEQEWRLVYVPPTDIDLRFRKGKSMIIPYTSLDISAGENLCIRHAFVGPCPHMTLSTRSAESMLVRNNIIALVHPSTIPFRDW
jgi:predicted nucleic acid-binding protein